MFNQTLTLANGVVIPQLALGTWLVDDGDVAEPVYQALKMGYRHVDTAQAYGNERGVGEGLHKAFDEGIVTRDEVFVTTKVQAEHKDHDSAAASIDESLEKLGLDHVDLVIIHSPQPWDEFRGEKRYFDENVQVWKALEEALAAGRTRAIGVSNFLVDDLQNVLDHATTAPMVNQVLAHVGNTPFDLVEFSQGKDVVVEAYSPIAHGEMLDNEQVQEIAKRYDVGVAQLCIRYCVLLGMVVLPKTTNPEHMASNADLDFQISEQDMAALKQLRSTDYGDSSKFPVFAGK